MTRTQTQETQAKLTPSDALAMLKDGNARFAAGETEPRDLGAQVRETTEGQYPFAIVLGCIDSRVPPETVFDLGIGDIFSARVAGNVLSDDVLGSMEFACGMAGALAVVVLGHTGCGAIKGATSGVELGHLTQLLRRIEPAMASVTGQRGTSEYAELVAISNVDLVVDQIRERSPLLASLEEAQGITIVGAMYDVATGVVQFR
ncbi:MAG: carbonic anhydrase family protein [Longimicrobiales bacterium]